MLRADPGTRPWKEPVVLKSQSNPQRYELELTRAFHELD